MTAPADAFGANVAKPFRVLCISGSLRAKSTNTAVLRTATVVAPGDIDVTVYDGLADLPPFNPDDDVAPLPPSVDELRARIRGADGLLFSTPEYAGALPGSFKNLLDWTIGDDQPGSIYEKPVAWINASPRGATHAHESLRLVLGYAHAHVIARACVDVPVNAGDVDARGLVAGSAARTAIAGSLSALKRGSSAEHRA
jgi:chromate reductase